MRYNCHFIFVMYTSAQLVEISGRNNRTLASRFYHLATGWNHLPSSSEYTISRHSLYICSLALCRFALRLIHSHNGATGVFWPKCRVVYFRFGANMTDPSSKIDIRRLKVGDSLIQLSVGFYIVLLPGLVFLVLSRS